MITASRPILAVEKEPATLWRETEDRQVPRAHRLAEDALGSIVGRDVEGVDDVDRRIAERTLS